MKGLLPVGRKVVVVGVLAVALAAGAALVPVAQTRDTATAEAQAQTQALRELVSEVRALRGVIEGYTEGQIRQQTLSDLLAVQQRRVSDANNRLDTARRELDGVSDNVRRLQSGAASLEEGARRTTDAKERAAIEMQFRVSKEELDRATEQESQIRARESEALSAVGFEEAKWNELVDRVNRSLTR